MFDPSTEARTYPLIFRVVGRSLRQVPDHVRGNEEVLVTAPASSAKPRAKRQSVLSDGQYTTVSFYSYFVVVATSVRLLVLEVFRGSGGRSYSLPYADITSWTMSLERLRGGSPLFRRVGHLTVASPKHQLDLNRIPPKKVSQLQDVVDPRLPTPVRATSPY
jgi:hypothetical protein